jgi:hypothetical protein
LNTQLSFPNKIITPSLADHYKYESANPIPFEQRMKTKTCGLNYQIGTALTVTFALGDP